MNVEALADELALVVSRPDQRAEFARIIRIHQIARPAPVVADHPVTLITQDDPAAGFRPDGHGHWIETEARYLDRVRVARRLTELVHQIRQTPDSVYRVQLCRDLALVIEHFTLSHEYDAAGHVLGVPRNGACDEWYVAQLRAAVVGL